MKVPGSTFLVGGAVRDLLLQRPVGDRDWVVVGSTEEKMLRAGFSQVGKAFPVFLHPQTQEEFALARTEKKISAGHTGFEVNADQGVKLDEDLARRDLTINAIAVDDHNQVIDPFKGVQDIENRVFRHVSDAFREDPLRCFRVARFAATFPEFTIAEETLDLLNEMADELYELPAERVWQEFSRAMQQDAPEKFFKLIHEACIENPWFSDFDVAQLSSAMGNARREATNEMLFSWYLEPDQVTTFLSKLKTPNRVLRVATCVSRYGKILQKYRDQTPQVLLETFNGCECFRDHSMYLNVLDYVEKCGQIDLRDIRDLTEELRHIKVQAPEGPEYGKLLEQQRLYRIELFLQSSH